MMLTISSQTSSFAASRASIDATYKKMFRQLSSQGNNEAIAAMSYYDVEVKAAIGKMLDGKIKCDAKSKRLYKSIAFDTLQSERDQFIYGFYMGFCNSQ